MAKQPWKPREFIYEFTQEELTSSAGLGPLIDLFCASPQFAEFRKWLPKRCSNASFDTGQFALSLLSGFWYGHDCLDDLEDFEKDPSVEEKLEELPSVRAAGDWLRDFTPEHLEGLNLFLTRQTSPAANSWLRQMRPHRHGFLCPINLISQKTPPQVRVPAWKTRAATLSTAVARGT